MNIQSYTVLYYRPAYVKQWEEAQRKRRAREAREKVNYVDKSNH